MVEFEGDVRSLSPAVEMERLLEVDGSFGAEKVLETADAYDS
jgi:hypothetical protein